MLIIAKASSEIKKPIHSYAAVYVSDEFVVIILGKTNVDEAASYQYMTILYLQLLLC